MSISRTKILGIAVVVSLALTALGLGVDAKSSARASGGKGVAHANGKVVAAGKLPVAKTFSVGHHALEPTLGTDHKGHIFYAAAGFDIANRLATTEIMKSANGGETWKVTSPRFHEADPISLDPYVWVDDQIGGDGARIFSIDLTVACSYLSFSDDSGQSWVTNPLACGRPVNDHQTLFGGPPVSSPTVGYPNVLYYCWNDVASSACSKSLDGGITFHPTGEPAYRGYDHGSDDPGFYRQDGFCGGLHGHGVVGPDGTVYLPREYCGIPTVAVSRDEGRTWDVRTVSKLRSTSQPKTGTGHPSVAVDKKGNVYYLWVADKNRKAYLSVSKNHGKSWSKPIEAGLPGLKETNLVQIDARGVGKVALVYYGSTNSPFPKCRFECTEGDYKNTTWNAYLGVSANALSKNPTFYTGTVNDPSQPLVRNMCGPGRCRMVFDFIDVEIDRFGTAYGAFVDSCMKGCTAMEPDEGDYEGLITKLVGGPRLN